MKFDFFENIISANDDQLAAFRKHYPKASKITFEDTGASLRMRSYLAAGLTFCHAERPAYSIEINDSTRFAVILPEVGAVGIRSSRGDGVCQAGQGLMLTRLNSFSHRTTSGKKTVFSATEDYIRELFPIVAGIEWDTEVEFFRLIEADQPYFQVMNRLFSTIKEIQTVQLAGRVPKRELRRCVDILCWEIARELPSIQQTKPVSEQRVRFAEDYIENHAQNMESIADAARACGCSLRSLQLAFREHRGITPTQFWTQCRLSNVRAKLLNNHSGLTATMIAADCGFYHYGRFARMYRNQFGESPSATRQSLLPASSR